MGCRTAVISPFKAEREVVRAIAAPARPPKPPRSRGTEWVPMGSASAKAMAIVRGEAGIYLHSGGRYEWDSCAPVAVVLAHGLHVRGSTATRSSATSTTPASQTSSSAAKNAPRACSISCANRWPDQMKLVSGHCATHTCSKKRAPLRLGCGLPPIMH